MKSSTILAALAFASNAVGSSSFVVVAPPTCGSSSTSITARFPCKSDAVVCMSSQDGAMDRINFLSSAAAVVAAGATGLGLCVPAGIAADQAGQLGDLEGGEATPMGSGSVTAGESLSEDAARIQRKLAAQAKVTGKTSSGQMTYSESRAAEEDKQAKMKVERNDKAKRRAAMCEELGRGC